MAVGSQVPGWVGAAPVGGGSGESGSVTIPVVWSVPPVSEIMPPVGYPFDAGGQLLAALGAAFQTITGTPYTVPQGRVGYLKGVTFHALNLVPGSLIYWTVRRNQVPIVGLANIFVQPGTIAVYDQGRDVTVRLEPGDAVDMQVSVQDGGTYQLGGELNGWTVPSKLADASASIWRMS